MNGNYTGTCMARGFQILRRDRATDASNKFQINSIPKMSTLSPVWVRHKFLKKIGHYKRYLFLLWKNWLFIMSTTKINLEFSCFIVKHNIAQLWNATCTDIHNCRGWIPSRMIHSRWRYDPFYLASKGKKTSHCDLRITSLVFFASLLHPLQWARFHVKVLDFAVNSFTSICHQNVYVFKNTIHNNWN